ncbi:MAG: metallophosphoesterase [Verrucomicrobiota bacterium]
MIDPSEKSTEVRASQPRPRSGSNDDQPSRSTSVEIAPGVRLDSRLAIFHQGDRWLALADLHFGYEVSRRADGGLWPLWGMRTIEERLEALVADWNPKTLILVGDIVDSAAAPREAIAWLERLGAMGPELVLVEGNHDRGEVRRHFEFVPEFRAGGFLFHHGHLPRIEPGRDEIEVTGHFHPSTRFGDGAGTSLKLPTFTREIRADSRGETWTLPAFSPWAGGHPASPQEVDSEFRCWACGGERVFEVAV